MNIYQEDLGGFLAIAEKLGLKGLTGVTSKETVEPKETEYAVQKLHKVKPKEEINLNVEGVITDNVQEVNFEEPSYKEFDTSRSLVVANVYMDYKDLDGQIMSMMEKREGIWSCKVCGKTDEKLNKKKIFSSMWKVCTWRVFLIRATDVVKLSGPDLR